MEESFKRGSSTENNTVFLHLVFLWLQSSVDSPLCAWAIQLTEVLAFRVCCSMNLSISQRALKTNQRALTPSHPLVPLAHADSYSDLRFERSAANPDDHNVFDQSSHSAALLVFLPSLPPQGYNPFPSLRLLISLLSSFSPAITPI